MTLEQMQANPNDEIERLRTALATLVAACSRYDEDPNSLTTAVYQLAHEKAREALAVPNGAEK